MLEVLTFGKPRGLSRPVQGYMSLAFCWMYVLINCEKYQRRMLGATRALVVPPTLSQKPDDRKGLYGGIKWPVKINRT